MENKNVTKDSEDYVCSKCGETVKYDDKICSNCGTDVSDIEKN